MPVLILLASLLAACAADERPTPPAPPTIEALGILASLTGADPIWTYTLVDGRAFTVDTDVPHVLWKGGGTGDPFVLGSSDGREFVGVFLHQDGMPPDCHLAGIGSPAAIERGDHIEIHGVLWRKSDAFQATALPSLGATFPTSSRSCFDEEAQVTSVVP